MSGSKFDIGEDVRITGGSDKYIGKVGKVVDGLSFRKYLIYFPDEERPYNVRDIVDCNLEKAKQEGKTNLTNIEERVKKWLGVPDLCLNNFMMLAKFRFVPDVNDVLAKAQVKDKRTTWGGGEVIYTRERRPKEAAKYLAIKLIRKNIEPFKKGKYYAKSHTDG